MTTGTRPTTEAPPDVGTHANLVLLDADRREDIRNSGAIAAIMLDCRFVERAELETMMSERDARCAPWREAFSPQAQAILPAA
jgi:hypothetical protein